MNILTFVIVAWLVSVLSAWIFEQVHRGFKNWVYNGGYDRLRYRLFKRFMPKPKPQSPPRSFDPDETMQLAVQKYRKYVREQETQVFFIVTRNPPPAPKRRHAK
jgi:hypothetical protein